MNSRFCPLIHALVEQLKEEYYNPQNEMLPFYKTKCSETQNEASSLQMSS